MQKVKEKMNKFCGNCGKPINKDALKCEYCGKSVNSISSKTKLSEQKERTQSGNNRIKHFGKWILFGSIVAVICVGSFLLIQSDQNKGTLFGTALEELMPKIVNENIGENAGKTESMLSWVDEEPVSSLGYCSDGTREKSGFYTEEDYFMCAGSVAELINWDKRTDMICAAETDLNNDKKNELTVITLNHEDKNTVLSAKIYEKQKGKVTLLDEAELTCGNSLYDLYYTVGLITLGDQEYLYCQNYERDSFGRSYGKAEYQLYQIDEGNIVISHELKEENDGIYYLYTYGTIEKVSIWKRPNVAPEYLEGKYDGMEEWDALRAALERDLGFPEEKPVEGVIPATYQNNGYPVEPLCVYDQRFIPDLNGTDIDSMITICDLTE